MMLRVVLAVLLLAGCAAPAQKKGASCKEAPNPDCACIELMRPVSGCDGKTYANSCKAGCAGVYHTTPGPCSERDPITRP